LSVQSVSEIARDEIIKIVEAYPQDRRHGLAILQDIQRKFNHMPREAFEILAAHFGAKAAHFYSMATFYRAFSLKPKGKHVIRVCNGTAYHIRGAPALLVALQRALGIKVGETTKDGMFSIDAVACMGACSIAPVMAIGERHFSKVKAEEVKGILDVYRAEANREGANG